MIHAVLFILIILTLLFLRTKLRKTPLAKLSPLQQTLAALGLLIFLLLALTGKLGLLIPLVGAVAAAFVALASRMMPILGPMIFQRLPEWLDGFRRGSSADQQDHEGKVRGRSTVRTAYLIMELDHESGQIHGSILDGPYQGQTLDQLPINALVEIYKLYHRDDPESARLLAAYIEQQHGERQGRVGDMPEMNRSEALQILGLSDNASESEILAQHRSLIQKLHPDRGGSNYLAARINKAKETLVSQKPTR